MLDNLLVIGQEEKVVSKRRQVCLTMRHDDFDDGEILHAVQRFCKVAEEELAESLFDIIPTSDVEDATNVAIEGGETTGREIPRFSVDDNNDPAPEILRLQLKLSMMGYIEHGGVSL